MEPLFIWVVGSPRSGTTFITDYIGRYVDETYNEPWKSHPLEAPRLWKFPPKAEKIVFKYCENWRNIHVLMNKWPNSLYVHVTRDPDNVVQSMAFPKDDSYPPRNLYAGYPDDRERTRLCMQRWFSNAMQCLGLANVLPSQYMEIRYENMKPGLKELGDRAKVNFDLNALDFRSKNLSMENKLEWGLNPTAQQLRTLAKKHVLHGAEGTLAAFINKRRPKFLQRVVL